jgi:hypothetical protein
VVATVGPIACARENYEITMGVSIIHYLKVSNLRVCVGAQACTPPSLHSEGLKGVTRWLIDGMNKATVR